MTLRARLPLMRSRAMMIAAGWSFSFFVLVTTGCQDGPLYALKVANPYYSLKEWRDEEIYGKTDHERWQELLRLSDSIPELAESEQARWVEQFSDILENDDSAEMRRVVVLAAGRLDSAESLSLLESGLNDVSTKVRMEACRSLGHRDDEEAIRLLASTFGRESNQDVKNAAVIALASHTSEVAIDSLRLALTDRNPATRVLAVESLKQSTGKNYGDDPQEWIAALDGQPVAEEPVRFADRIMDLF